MGVADHVKLEICVVNLFEDCLDIAVNEGGKGISNFIAGYCKLSRACLRLWQKLDDAGVDELKESYVVATDLEGHNAAVSRVNFFFRSLGVVAPEQSTQIMWPVERLVSSKTTFITFP